MYFAGVTSLITHERRSGRDYLTQYLRTSNTLDSDPERRKEAYRLLQFVPPDAADAAAKPAPGGTANWLSGATWPADVYYDPVSLAFQPGCRPSVAATRWRCRLEWDPQGKLRGVTTTFDRPQLTKPAFYFGYDKRTAG